jgi:hypothetical protein
MNPITDDDLVLYHYRDGLDAQRIEQITAALATSETLRERYAAIERAVAQFGQDEIVPDPEFSARLWQKLEPQLENAGVVARENANVLTGAAARGQANVPAGASSARSSVRVDASRPAQGVVERVRSWLMPAQLWPAFAASTVLAVAIGAAFLAGRESATVSTPVASTEADAAAGRVLDAYVAANLRATERVLLTASNSDDASLLEGNRELAQSLVESNRLYSLAAARAGNTRLATFLRQIEPILISLANQPGSAAVQSSEDLRQFLDTTDLLFQVRATEARLDRAPDNDGDSRI